MRPRPLPILLLLLAGAVVNVGVAWGCALRAQQCAMGSSAEGTPPAALAAAWTA